MLHLSTPAREDMWKPFAALSIFAAITLHLPCPLSASHMHACILHLCVCAYFVCAVTKDELHLSMLKCVIKCINMQCAQPHLPVGPLAPSNPLPLPFPCSRWADNGAQVNWQVGGRDCAKGFWNLIKCKCKADIHMQFWGRQTDTCLSSPHFLLALALTLFLSALSAKQAPGTLMSRASRTSRHTQRPRRQWALYELCSPRNGCTEATDPPNCGNGAHTHANYIYYVCFFPFNYFKCKCANKTT